MSDLISRSELINKIRGIVPSSQDVDFIVRLIDALPTAYDKDKVVEEINNIDLQHPCDDCPHLEECDRIQMECSNAHDLCALVTKHYAIEAVRKGGAE